MHKKKALYLGNYQFADGNAAGKRVHGNAQLLEMLGYEVIVIDARPLGSNNQKELIGRCVEGFDTYSVAYPVQLKDWLKVRHNFRLVSSVLDQHADLELVIMYGNTVLSLFNIFVIRYCRRRNIKVVADVVDWLSVKSKSKIYNFMKMIDDWFQKSIANVMCDGVICISAYFEKYYKSRGKVTVVLPPLKKSLSFCEPHTVSSMPTLVYAGRPFREDMLANDTASLKDRIDLVFEHLLTLKNENLLFELHIYGFNISELIKVLPKCKSVIERLGSSVIFHGMTPNNVVLDQMRTASFSILIRDRKRETIAGFPTKIAESISNHVPVLVTEVGDINSYVDIGKTGFCAEEGDQKAHIEMIRSALLLSDSEIIEMKNNCAKTIIFTPDCYLDQVRKFLNNV